MHILVTAVSKHGPAHEIAEATAHGLEDTGHNVDVVAPVAAESVNPYDMVVCGSTAYILQWMDEVKSFLERFTEQLRTKRVRALLVGMNGVPKHVPQGPIHIGPALMHVLVIDKHTSAGCYKPSPLSLREHLVTRLASVVEGDFRDWGEVEAWADSIVVELSDKD